MQKTAKPKSRKHGKRPRAVRAPGAKKRKRQPGNWGMTENMYAGMHARTLVPFLHGPPSITSSPTCTAHAQASSPLPVAVQPHHRPRPPPATSTPQGSSAHRISRLTSDLRGPPPIPSARNASPAGSLAYPNGGRLP